MNRFGRDELEWQELLDSATDQLKTLARSQRLTTYGELNASLAHETGLAAFDLGTEGGRHALGQLLGDVTRADYPTSGLLLSALCSHKGGVDVGGGFFELAVELGLLAPKPSAAAKDEFWIKAVNSVFGAYAEGAQ